MDVPATTPHFPTSAFAAKIKNATTLYFRNIIKIARAPSYYEMKTSPNCRSLSHASIVSEAFEIVKRLESSLLFVRWEFLASYDSNIINKPNSQRNSTRDIEDFGDPQVFCRRKNDPSANISVIRRMMMLER